MDNEIKPASGLEDITSREFADKITALLPEIFAEKRYVYGDIRILETQAADGTAVTAIVIGIPGEDSTVCFYCGGKRNEYAGYCAAPDAEPDKVLRHMAGTLADEYNREHISHIKYAADYEALKRNVKDKDYVMRFAKPEIINASGLSESADDLYGCLLNVPLDADINKTGIETLAYAFRVIDPKYNADVLLRRGDCDFSPEELAELSKKATVNLNNMILGHLTVEDAVEYGIRTSFPVKLPKDITSRIVSDIKSQATVNSYVVKLDNTPLKISGVLLSRTAMLKIAKKLGAKHKLQVIPQYLHSFLMINADDPAGTLPDKDAADIAGRFAERDTDQTRVMLKKPMIYDVINGTIV